MNQFTQHPPQSANTGSTPLSREEILELLGKMQVASEKRYTVSSYPAIDTQAVADRP